MIPDVSPEPPDTCAGLLVWVCAGTSGVIHLDARCTGVYFWIIHTPLDNVVCVCIICYILLDNVYMSGYIWMMDVISRHPDMICVCMCHIMLYNVI